MKRDLHSKINLRPQLIKAITKSAITKGQDISNPLFRIIAGLRSNKMVLNKFL